MKYSSWLCFGFICAMVAIVQPFGFASNVQEARARLADLQDQIKDTIYTPEEGRAMNSPESEVPSKIRAWNKNEVPDPVVMTSVMKLKTPQDKMSAIRKKLLQKIVQESRQVSSNNESVITIAMLAFGVLLFDLIGDALFGTSNDIFGVFGGDVITARETMLPSFGLFGDNVNNMAEIALNMLTIYMYRDESPDCGERLLCESNQQAVSRGLFDSFLTYLSGFAMSFFLGEAPVSQNLEAMRAGRTGKHCGEIYPRCAISL